MTDLDQLILLASEAAERASSGPTDAEQAAADAVRRAMTYIAQRPRTERQVRDKLAESGFGREAVGSAIERLVELGLLDDLSFSRTWIQERARTKGKAPGILVSELRARGIAREVAERALAEVGPDEETQVVEVAQKLCRRVARYPLADQATKLHQMLLRRGFSHELATHGARAVLPPEGWD